MYPVPELSQQLLAFRPDLLAIPADACDARVALQCCGLVLCPFSPDVIALQVDVCDARVVL